jgi:hypothetical protein
MSFLWFSATPPPTPTPHIINTYGIDIVVINNNKTYFFSYKQTKPRFVFGMI